MRSVPHTTMSRTLKVLLDFWGLICKFFEAIISGGCTTSYEIKTIYYTFFPVSDCVITSFRCLMSLLSFEGSSIEKIKGAEV